MLSADTVSRATVNLASDPIMRLPAEAAAKLRKLRQRQSELGVIARDLAERQHAAGMRKIEAQAACDRQRASPGRRQYFGGMPGDFVGGTRDDPSAASVTMHYAPADNSRAALAAAETELAEATAALAALAEQIAAIRARQSDLPRRLDAWLRALPPGIKIKLHHDEPVKVKGDPRIAVETARARIAELRADLHAVKSAPYPARVAKETARRQIEALAEAGRPDYLRTLELNRAPGLPMLRHDFLGIVAAARVDVIDSAALLCWLHKDAMIVRMEREIDELAGDDGSGLDDDERAARTAEISAEILVTERGECAAIEIAGEDAISYRPDTSPEAVLGLAVLGLAA